MGRVRASIQRRDRTVGALKNAYVADQLSTGTFELRVAGVIRAKTRSELRDLVSDLPTWTGLVARVRRRWGADGHVREADDSALVVTLDRLSLRAVLGRRDGCEVRIDDPTVSRVHASLRRERGEWVLVDLGSRNGTFIDGRRVERACVHRGDELRLGAMRLRVE
ncbi:MAG: hypothetical protein JWM71_2032 [Solirubrobacteraceae bacterium]|nr:hypothetical protein [Solirubrobacteraceae bacterium]